MFAVSASRMLCVTPSYHTLPVLFWMGGASLGPNQKQDLLVLRGMHRQIGTKIYFLSLKWVKSGKNRRELGYRKIIVSFKLLSSL